MSSPFYFKKSPAINSTRILALLLLVTSGCGSQKTPAANDSAATDSKVPIISEPLNILVIDNPDIGPVMARQYAARSSGTINVIDTTWTEFESQAFSQLDKSDVIIYPAPRLGELVESGLIHILKPGELRDEDSRRAVLTFDRDHVASWHGVSIGISMGQLIPVLLVRNDVLQWCGKEIPETWEAFSAIRQLLAEKDSAKQMPAAVAVPMADHWASYMLMARTAAMIRTQGRYSSFFDVGDMRPLIGTEPYLRALQGWSADLNGQEGDEARSPAQILQQFLAGELAMAITVVHPKMLAEEITPGFDFVVGPVPGSKEVFDFDSQVWTSRPPEQPSLIPLVGCGGMVASVTATTERSRVAADFLSWLQDKQISAIIGLESQVIGPSQKTHLASPGKWMGSAFTADNATQYARCIQSANDARICLVALRIRSSDLYLEALDNAVREAISGTKNAVEALAQVQIKWNELNNEIGLEKQRKAYRGSEGLSN